MTTADRINAARDQLNRTMGFFPRVDAKASVMFGVNTALLAVLATRAVPYGSLRWEWVLIGITVFLIAVSYWNLYKGAFPALDGGQESLLYFKEISRRTEAKYADAWQQMTDESYLLDLVGQIWRNSQILDRKFYHVKWAFYSLAVSLVPWLMSIVLLAIRALNP